MNNKTFLSSDKNQQRKWYVIDCEGKGLGRTSSIVTGILQGKHKLWYDPSGDMRDCVILVNAMDLTLGNSEGRTYVFSPGRPGGSLSFKKMSEDFPDRVIETCIKNMMGEGAAKRALPKRLKIYTTPDHPHGAQNPISLNNKEEIKIHEIITGDGT